MQRNTQKYTVLCFKVLVVERNFCKYRLSNAMLLWQLMFSISEFSFARVNYTLKYFVNYSSYIRYKKKKKEKITAFLRCAPQLLF